MVNNPWPDLWRLRELAVKEGGVAEKQFHDAVLDTGLLSIEMVKARIVEDDLRSDWKTSWKFLTFHEKIGPVVM